MKYLITTPQGWILERFFPEALLRRLDRLGEVTVNPHTRPYTKEELLKELADTDVVLTHWGSVQYGRELLDGAPGLKVLAHCAGTVAHIASEECYRRGITVLSANPVMARYVAEGVLAYILASLREICRCDADMRDGVWLQRYDTVGTLFGADIGMVGLGTVGRCVLKLLAPFAPEVCVYDPYIPDSALEAWPFAHRGSFEEAMERSVVTIHAAQTPETYHLIDAAALRHMPQGALLINTSRGSLVDPEALTEALEAGRIRAALDVYETGEGGPQDPRLRALKDRTLLMPHVAALPAGSRMTEAIVGDLERMAKGEPMQLAVGYGQYIHMTQE